MKILRISLLFLFLMLTGGILGGLLASLFIEKGSGLVGGAIVFWGMLFGSLTGISAAILIKSKAEARKIIGLNLSLAILLFFLFIYLGRNAKAASVEASKNLPGQSGMVDMGIGLATPKFFEKKAVYFYNPNLEKSLDEHTPVDSIRFEQTELGFTISHAPPWLYPQHMKMDYEILKFKVTGRTTEWIQVEVNQQTHKKAWMNINDLKLESWEEFLLSVSSIEPLQKKENIIRIKPLENASEVSFEESLLKPVEIRSEWIRVQILDDRYQKTGEGWIKWRENEKMLISYNILS